MLLPPLTSCNSCNGGGDGSIGGNFGTGAGDGSLSRDGVTRARFFAVIAVAVVVVTLSVWFQ